MRHSKVWAVSLPAFALLMLLASARTASACSCVRPGPPCEAYGSASAVFVGTVIGVETRERGDKSEDAWGRRVFKFAVAQAFLGVEGAEVEVATGMGGGDCGYGFRRGETYLVYADLGGSEGRRVLMTSICSRTRPFSSAAEDLEFLRGLAAREPGVSISGTVFRRTLSVKSGDSQPAGVMPGAALTIDGEGVRRELRTDANGRYSLSGLKPGAYKVRLTLPEELTVYQPEQEVAVADRGCANVNYHVSDNGRIGGRVFDAEGRPVARILVTLAEEGAHDPEQNYNRMERTDDEGRYSFSGLPPGRYVLAVNLTRHPEPGDPTSAFPRTYYPGVARVEEAEAVKLGAGENVTGRDVRLPPPRAESVVEGQVVWADGTPVAKARLSLRDVTAHENGLNTGKQADEAGRFTIKGYVGQTLLIEAWSGRPFVGDLSRDGPMERAEPARVRLASAIEPVRITITKLR